MKNMVFLLIAVFLFSPSCFAGDWPMVRADAARSGYSAESVSPALTLQWIYRSLHEPQPAWEAGDTRMRFDHAFHTVVSDGLLYFGSSVNGKIYALDVETGQKVWDFFTGGPVRFAPAVWKDRLFAVSEDGYLYCLNKGTGEELWKKSGAPKPDKLLGNDRMVSRWVPRGGPFVSGKTVCFAAGVWPTEGIYFYALDAETGAEKWVNDSAGDLVMLQPHSAWSRSGVSAQGYLAAKDGMILSPTGRAVPAAFDMLNGTFQYFHLNRYSPGGGSFIAMAGHGFFNGGKIFDIQSGELLQNLKANTFAVTPKGGVAGYPGRIQALQWADMQKTDRKGGQYSIKQLQPLWDLETEHSGVSLIVAGKHIVSGGEASVCVITREEQKVLRSVKVEGQPLGLAAAGNRIYVST
ncbi:PQQ-binding-like beta-propeller repeat protein, partial [bacterium]|nr:PQQ-binding-like beta-propeller repeat protein [bacterium]